jgi:hypothetical protein
MDDAGHAARALSGTSPRDPDAAAARDPRSTADLLALYISDPDTDEAGIALSVIHYRGGPEEFAAAESLARSRVPHERRVAADILAQLGWQDRTYLDQSLSVLLCLLGEATGADRGGSVAVSGSRLRGGEAANAGRRRADEPGHRAFLESAWRTGRGRQPRRFQER